MKSLMLLVESVLLDCSIRCDTTTTSDVSYIRSRVKHEGLSFLTITLGDFAQDFERSLEESRIDSTFFRSFRKNGTIPRLFAGMTSQVFDLDGRLLDQPSIEAILCIRQICRMFKKILVPCTKERELAAINGYIELERSLSMRVHQYVDSRVYSTFLDVCCTLWSEVLGPVSQRVCLGLHVPKHGSGATATKTLQNQKYNVTEWHQRLEQYFPSDNFCYANSMSFLEECSKITYRTPEHEQPVRVVLVPKTLKTPRVIGVEPACMQYAQQSLLSPIVSAISTHRFTCRHVNFADQTINARLAIEGSKSGELATLDLSEASDRVHHAVVFDMLNSVPALQEAIFSCRSTSATLPTGYTTRLEKFASMGSALCFPIESMLFYSLLITSELLRLNLPCKGENVLFVSRKLFVYGDDLVLPVESVSSAVHILESFGLKVNSHKSFFKGNFRESCGTDAYAGQTVTTVFVRRMLPISRHDAHGVVSAVSLRNQLFKAGFHRGAVCVEDLLSNQGHRIPDVSDTSACVGYVGNKYLTTHRYNDKLHRPEVRGYVVVVKKTDDHIDGHQALMKWFLQGLNPDINHYKHSVSSGSFAIKTRWSSVF